MGLELFWYDLGHGARRNSMHIDFERTGSSFIYSHLFADGVAWPCCNTSHYKKYSIRRNCLTSYRRSPIQPWSYILPLGEALVPPCDISYICFRRKFMLLFCNTILCLTDVLLAPLDGMLTDDGCGII